jgi:hypothetical protein
MFDAARVHRQGRGSAFKCLDASHLIDRDRLDAGLAPFEGKSMGLVDVLTFLFEVLVVLCRQPAGYPMRL